MRIGEKERTSFSVVFSDQGGFQYRSEQLTARIGKLVGVIRRVYRNDTDAVNDEQTKKGHHTVPGVGLPAEKSR